MQFGLVFLIQTLVILRVPKHSTGGLSPPTQATPRLHISRNKIPRSSSFCLLKCAQLALILIFLVFGCSGVGFYKGTLKRAFKSDLDAVAICWI